MHTLQSCSRFSRFSLLLSLLILTLVLGALLSPSPASAQDLVVGSNSSGQTTNFTSGTNNYSYGYIGYNTGDSNNLLTVSNTATLLVITNTLSVGYSGSSNSLTISNGAMAADNIGYLGVNSTSSNNSALVTGAGSLWSNIGAITNG